MATAPQPQQTTAPAGQSDDDQWWNPMHWLKGMFQPKQGGGGFDLFGMIFNTLIWGAVAFFAFTMLIVPNTDKIVGWLNGIHDGLGDTVGKGIDWVKGGLASLVGKFAPGYANDQALDMATKKPDDFKNKLITENKLSEPLADIITKNAATLLPLIASASGDPKKPIFVGAAFDKANLPKVLSTLATKLDPAIARQLLAAALQPGAGATASPQMMKDIVSTVLTAPEMQDAAVRAQVISLLKSIPVSDAKTQAALSFVGNEKNLAAASACATALGPDKFDTLLTAFTTLKDGKPDFTSDAMKAVQEAVKDADYANALKTFASSVDLNSVSNDDIKGMISGLKANPQGVFDAAAKASAASAALPANPTAVGPAGQPGNGQGAGSGNSAAQAATPPAPPMDLATIFKSDFTKLNDDDANNIARMMSKQAQATQDAATKFLAFTQGTDAHGQPNHPNMVAGMEFMKKVQMDDHGGAQIAAADQAIIGKLMKYLGGDKTALNPGDAHALATFFNTPGNMQAFINYTGAVRSPDPKVQQFMKLLHDHLHHGKSAEGGTGIEQILTDEKSLNVMLQAITRKDHKVDIQLPLGQSYAYDISGNSAKSDPNDFVQNTKKAATKKTLESFGYAPLADNYSDIQALGAAAAKLQKIATQR